MHPNDGRVVSNFIVQALLGRDITIFGDGQQTRSFCYVDDMIDALVRLMDTADDVTGPINIGNPNEFTMLELASMVVELTASRSHIIHRPLPQDDPRQRRPDISKANDLLGWAPQTALRDGLITPSSILRGYCAPTPFGHCWATKHRAPKHNIAMGGAI
jgi:UDP-glucuronate decarboxylase